MSKLSTMQSVGFVACAPFEVKHIENKVKNGVAFSEQRASLTELKVVCISKQKMGESDRIYAGSSIWVRGESFKAEWARKEYDIDGEKFILVPFDAVILINHGNTIGTLTAWRAVEPIVGEK